MAHTNSRNTFVGKPTMVGGIWKVPFTVALPTDASSPIPPEAVLLGGVSENGIKFTTTRDTEKKIDWNSEKVRSIQTSKDDTLEVEFIEFLNPAVLALVHGSDNVTVVPATATTGTQITTKSVSDQLEHAAYIIDVLDGKAKRRHVIPDAQPDQIADVMEKPGDLSIWGITFDLFPDTQGSTHYTYTLLDDPVVTAPVAAPVVEAPAKVSTAK